MAEGLCPAGLRILAAVERVREQKVRIGRGRLGIAWSQGAWRLACRNQPMPLCGWPTPLTRCLAALPICPLGALLLWEQPGPPDARDGAQFLGEYLGVPRAWIAGFTDAFDDKPGAREEPASYDAGYRTGRAVAAEVFGEAEPLPAVTD